MVHHAYMDDRQAKKKSRKRRYRGGRNPVSLLSKTNYCVFSSLSNYPLQEVLAFLFDRSQGCVSEWIHTLSTVLKMVLGKAHRYLKATQRIL
jgi:hypothetical protein